MENSIVDAVGAGNADFIDAGRLATRLMGNSIATNMFMLGYAFQRGLVPLSSAALLRAIELNGAVVEDNCRAFAWGRRTALDPAAVEALVAAGEVSSPAHRLSSDLDEIVERRRDYLTAYQDAAYARRYVDLVKRARRVGAGDTALADAVARNYFKLLAYKDEYEVARLFVDPEFQRSLAENFEGDYRLNFHMTLPWSRGVNPGEEPKKTRFGPWLLPAMKLLAGLKFLRGSALDPFGRSAERHLERELIDNYERTVEHILGRPDHASPDTALALVSIPDDIRGYGPVKERSILQAMTRQKELMAVFDQPPGVTAKAGWASAAASEKRVAGAERDFS